ncbi:Cullin-domain-containing protein [Clavulina sp. PMI_390]|nr:Cullin-domain-containing protein [Clavulina sp. PMI_390]
MSAPIRRGKGRIKPPRTLIAPESRNQETWRQLAENIQEIQNHNAFKLSFEENYRFAYNMVSTKQGKTLYEGTKSLIVANLEKLAQKFIVPTFPMGSNAEGDAMQDATQGEQLLKAFRHVWDDHTSSMSKLKDILKYMDRVHCPAVGVPQILDAGLQLFIDHIIRSPTLPIRQHMLSAILRQLRLERDGYPVNRSAIKEAIEVYRNLNDQGDSSANASVFKKELEPSIFRETDSYYKEEGNTLIASCNAPEYLQRVEGRLQSESQRCSLYFRLSTTTPILTSLKANLLAPSHLEAVLSMPGSGLDNMIDANQLDDLGRLYELFALVEEGMPSLKRKLRESIGERGKQVNQAEGSLVGVDGNANAAGDGDADGAAAAAGPTNAGAPNAKKTLDAALKWVQDVLDLKDIFDKVLRICFKDDKGIQIAMNEAFETFINQHPKAPEFISLFIDENLKKGLKGKTDDEIELVLEKTITVFRFITDKDVFERYYKAHLAKRLLQNRSVSDDAEKGMLAKLKVECGFQFTQKLEGMFNDMKMSEDMGRDWKGWLERTGVEPPPIDLSVQVLTSTFWPFSSHVPSPCTFSPSMLASTAVFERFYLSRHSGRRLSWQPSHGNADVRVAFKKRSHDLNVSTYALVILLLFEDLGSDEKLGYRDIKLATDIPDGELMRNLQSLACAKFKILKKHPPGRDVAFEDQFSFNADFSAPMQKIKISTVSAKVSVESSEESRETKDRVDEERRFQMEACIVRVMKDRKRMTHNDLLNEVTKQLTHRFLPNPLEIKKRIEALLDREYLDRGEDKRSYIYVA